ncbi:MAG: hypothetical protein M5T61_02205 [Acidimicrobiia bacterium]|nr:hypothetical protein [Acidimicrobiia bacterium]
MTDRDADGGTMGAERTEWTAIELLESDEVAEPLLAGGVRCHGGFGSDGGYLPPRTRFRTPAIEAWQARHRDEFRSEIIEAPLDMWPEPYPNLAQTRYLLGEGVRDPIVTILTRIGTVEGFGALIRHVGFGDPQRHFAESVAGTAVAHLENGLFEAHARDEAGWESEAGHKDMWFAARDIAFEHPVTEDETALMLERMGISTPGAPPSPEAMLQAASEMRIFADIDLSLEMTIRRMISILLIEVQAFHLFAWAEDLLSDDGLVAGEGAAARLVACIRADETPHVEYLRTALTEMRDRTFVGESGRGHPGDEVIGRLWDDAVADSLGPRREQQLRTTVAEVEHALAGHRRRDEILEGFHARGTVHPATA